MGKRAKKRRNRKPTGYELALEDYRLALASLAQQASQEAPQRVQSSLFVATDEPWLTDNPLWNDAELLLQELRSARLFVVDPALFKAWYEAADRYTTEEVAGLRFRDVGDDAPPPHEIEQHLRSIAEAGRRVPLPDPARWPFKAMWVGYVDKRGTRAALTLGQLAGRVGHDLVNEHRLFTGHLLAHVFVSLRGRPYVFEVIQAWSYDADLADVAPALVFASAATGGATPGVEPMYLWDAPYLGEDWVASYGLAPWTTLALFSYLAQFRSFVIEQAWPRRTTTGPSLPGEPPARPLPPPYYLLRLRQQTAREEAPQRVRPQRSWRLQHRCDVMGHERVRLRRGHGALDLRERRKLLDRGYRVYDGRPVKPYDVERLSERSVRPPGANEWLAMKVSWVAEHQRGPADAPYIPALRVA